MTPYEVAEMTHDYVMDTTGRDVPSEFIYAQMRHETDDFSSFMTGQNNYGGIKSDTPTEFEATDDGGYYKSYADPKAFARDMGKTIAAYVKDWQGEGAMSLSDYVHALSDGELKYFTDDPTNYYNALANKLGQTDLAEFMPSSTPQSPTTLFDIMHGGSAMTGLMEGQKTKPVLPEQATALDKFEDALYDNGINSAIRTAWHNIRSSNEEGISPFNEYKPTEEEIQQVVKALPNNPVAQQYVLNSAISSKSLQKLLQMKVEDVKRHERVDTSDYGLDTLATVAGSVLDPINILAFATGGLGLGAKALSMASKVARAKAAVRLGTSLYNTSKVVRYGTGVALGAGEVYLDRLGAERFGGYDPAYTECVILGAILGGLGAKLSHVSKVAGGTPQVRRLADTVDKIETANIRKVVDYDPDYSGVAISNEALNDNIAFLEQATKGLDYSRSYKGDPAVKLYRTYQRKGETGRLLDRLNTNVAFTSEIPSTESASLVQHLTNPIAGGRRMHSAPNQLLYHLRRVRQDKRASYNIEYLSDIMRWRREEADAIANVRLNEANKRAKARAADRMFNKALADKRAEARAEQASMRVLENQEREALTQRLIDGLAKHYDAMMSETYKYTPRKEKSPYASLKADETKEIVHYADKYANELSEASANQIFYPLWKKFSNIGNPRLERAAKESAFMLAKMADSLSYFGLSPEEAVKRFAKIQYQPKARLIKDHTKGVFNQEAWESARVKFDAFDTSFIGTGEGSQVWGWGLYFAFNRQVAEKYKALFKRTGILSYIEDKHVHDLQLLSNLYPTVNIKALITALSDDPTISAENFVKGTRGHRRGITSPSIEDVQRAIDDILPFVEYVRKEVPLGYLYKADIPSDDVLMDLTKTFKEQPLTVQKALRQLLKEKEHDLTIFDDDSLYIKLIEEGQGTPNDIAELFVVQKADMEQGEAFFELCRKISAASPEFHHGFSFSDLVNDPQIEMSDNDIETFANMLDAFDHFRNAESTWYNSGYVMQSLTKALMKCNAMGRDRMRQQLIEKHLPSLDDKSVYDLYRELTRGFSGDSRLSASSTKELNLRLSSLGVKGHKYYGSRDHECAVVYDDKAAKILEVFEQNISSTIGGSYNTAQNLINLFESADPSTPFHEGGHWWLNLVEQLADEGNMRALKMKEDIWKWTEPTEKALEEYKDTPLEEEFTRYYKAIQEAKAPAQKEATIRRWRHERFVRGAERYVVAGQIGNKKMQGIFAKFREFLLDIYHTVTSLGKKPASKEVKQVYDIMLKGMMTEKNGEKYMMGRVQHLTHNRMKIDDVFFSDNNAFGNPIYDEFMEAPKKNTAPFGLGKLSRWFETSTIFGNIYGTLINSKAKGVATVAEKLLIDPRLREKNIGQRSAEEMKRAMTDMWHAEYNTYIDMRRAYLSKNLSMFKSCDNNSIRAINRQVIQCYDAKAGLSSTVKYEDFAPEIQQMAEQLRKIRAMHIAEGKKNPAALGGVTGKNRGLIDSDWMPDIDQFHRLRNQDAFAQFSSKFRTRQDVIDYLTAYAYRFVQRDILKKRFESQCQKDGVEFSDKAFNEYVADRCSKWAFGIVDEDMSRLEFGSPMTGGHTAISMLQERLPLDTTGEMLMPDGTTFSFDNNLREFDLDLFYPHLMDRFAGEIALNAAFDDVATELNTAVQSIGHTQGKRGKSISDKENEALKDAVDRILSSAKYNSFSNNSVGDAISKTMRSASYANVGGNMMWAQLGELGGMVAYGGLRTALSVVPYLGSYIDKLRLGNYDHALIHRIQDELFADDILTKSWNVTSSTESRAFREAYGDTIRGRALDKVANLTNKAALVTSTVNRMPKLTNAMVQSMRRSAIEDTLDWVRGKNFSKFRNPFTDKKLAAIGFTGAVDVEDFKASVRKYLTTGDIDGWMKEDPQNFYRWRALIDNQAMRGIQQSTIGNTNMFKEQHRLFFQFKDFTLRAINAQTLRAMQSRDLDDAMAALFSMMTNTATYAGLTYLRAWSMYPNDKDRHKRQKYLDKKLTLQNLALCGFVRGAFTGSMLSFGMDGYEALTGQSMFRTTVDRGDSKPKDFRMLSASQLAGQVAKQMPAIGVLDTLRKAGGSAYNTLFEKAQKQDIDNIIRALPLGSWVGMTYLSSFAKE